MALTVSPFPYQDEAIDMVLERTNGLIAYEMGLGKTMVGLAVIEELLAEPAINFALVVVPSGLKYQWAESIAKFTDVDTMQKKVKRESFTIPTPEWCTVVDGSPKERDAQYRFIEKNWPNYVIVSYEQVVNDYQIIKDLAPDCIVIDEATYIKGFKAARSQATKALGKDAEFRVALTGTPMENKPEEVFSIMEFVDHRVLGNPEQFDAKFIVRNNFGGVKRYRNLDILHKKLRPVMSRKTKLDPDVAPYMPKVQHKQEYVFLSKKAQRLYDEIAKHVVEDLANAQITGSFDLASYYSGSGNQDMSTTGRIMAKVMAMQMLCDHPDLLKISAQKYLDSDGEDGSAYAAELLDAGRLEDLGTPEKLQAVVADVKDILDFNPANKVIIFSFFKDMGRMLRDALEDYDSVIYNGNMSSGEKTAAKVRFQNNPDCRLFIASDAAAFGVDLPQANYLINYDLVESAGKMDQRNARHVRAGSSHKSVYVINYLVEGSVEERTFRRLEFKRRVASAVVDGKRTDEGGVIENSVESLTDFLTSLLES